MTERTKSITPQWYRLLKEHHHQDPDEMEALSKDWRRCAIGEGLDLQSLPQHERPDWSDENQAIANIVMERIPHLHRLGCDFHQYVQRGHYSRAQDVRREIQAFILRWGIDVLRNVIAENLEAWAERTREHALESEIWQTTRRLEREAVLEAAEGEE